MVSTLHMPNERTLSCKIIITKTTLVFLCNFVCSRFPVVVSAEMDVTITNKTASHDWAFINCCSFRVNFVNADHVSLQIVNFGKSAATMDAFSGILCYLRFFNPN